MNRFIAFVLAVSALALPATGLRLSPAAAASALQATSPCQNTQLGIQYHSSQGGAGHVYYAYRIHNRSAQACSLYGYPGVQLLDRHFVTLHTTVFRGLGPVKTLRSVRLTAGGNAYFTVGYSDVPTGNSVCPSVPYLMIWAPNNVLPVVTYAAHGGSVTACNGTLNVSPVTAQPSF